MQIISIALVVLLAGGLFALFFNKKPVLANRIGMAGTIIGSLMGVIPAIAVLAKGVAIKASLNFTEPYGQIGFCIDPLSAFFMTILLVIGVIISIYGYEYLSYYYGEKPIGVYWCFFTILIASLVLITMARNGLFFLIAWEVSAISSFFLITYEDEKKSVRKAGLIYLIAANIGSAFLLPLFILLGKGSLNFDDFTVASPLLFLLAFVGFGIKAGIIPFHVWLPQAHPAAPSPVSAFLSGVMIKMGVYGFLRMATFSLPPLWWAWLLISFGLLSGLLGILMALGQKDLKALLAYSSIENIGIIITALGLGFLGINLAIPSLMVLGIAGAILHILNHSVFKSLLFLGSGAVYHATGTRELNALGGLFKYMPRTGYCFLIGSLAIAAAPGLNGFLSEFLLYLGAFKGILFGLPYCLIIVIGLAAIGGLAAVCFSGVFGTVFLGEKRGDYKVHEVGVFMSFSLIFLAASCFLLSLFFPYVLSFFSPVISQIGGRVEIEALQKPLFYVIASSLFLLGLVGILFLLRKKRPTEKTVTWDCGYAKPTSRMQYNFSSFVEPLGENFKGVFGSSTPPLLKIFPQAGEFVLNASDLFYRYFYKPLFQKLYYLASKLRWLQQGSLHLYILYIFLTLLFLLIYKLQ